jgi:hypothetical protein
MQFWHILSESTAKMMDPTMLGRLSQRKSRLEALVDQLMALEFI